MGTIEKGWNNGPGRRSRQSDFVVPSHLNSAQLPPLTEDSGSAILGYWQLIKRRKWVVFITAVLGALTAFVVLLSQQPIYLTGSTVELMGFNSNFMGLAAIDPLAGNYSKKVSASVPTVSSSVVRR